MIGELARQFGVSCYAATLKARNFRSRGLLAKLGFELAGPLAGDEITMRKDP
jgi:RimJ/RimL family protein N-acetyltransferase